MIEFRYLRNMTRVVVGHDAKLVNHLRKRFKHVCIQQLFLFLCTDRRYNHNELFASMMQTDTQVLDKMRKQCRIAAFQHNAVKVVFPVVDLKYNILFLMARLLCERESTTTKNENDIYVQHLFQDTLSQDISFIHIVGSKGLIILKFPVSKLESRYDLSHFAAIFHFSSYLIHPL